MIQSEIFKDILGYDGLYQVSNFGNVKSLSRKQSTTERVLKGEKDSRGYVRVRFSRENKTKKFRKPYCKDQVNHIDGNPSNNDVNNLEWCTQSENMRHAFKIGLQSLCGENNTHSKLTNENVSDIRKLLKQGIYHKDIAKQFNVSRRCITDINVGNTWNHDL
jgi:hypothetical protein